jgi:ribosomal 50S subunit-recycling heat shock protein
MRIDKFLKISRILKRRTVAQEACGAGKVLINSKEAKQSHKIKIGDVVEINYVSGTLKFEILQVKEVVKKDDAPTLYKILGDDDEKA